MPDTQHAHIQVYNIATGVGVCHVSNISWRAGVEETIPARTNVAVLPKQQYQMTSTWHTQGFHTHGFDYNQPPIQTKPDLQNQE